MPENTPNDAPGADRPTTRRDQETPGRLAKPPGEAAAEREAERAVEEAAKRRPAKPGGS